MDKVFIVIEYSDNNKFPWEQIRGVYKHKDEACNYIAQTRGSFMLKEMELIDFEAFD